MVKHYITFPEKVVKLTLTYSGFEKFSTMASSAANRKSFIDSALAFMAEHGFAHRMSIASPIAGGDGNVETVAVFRKS